MCQCNVQRLSLTERFIQNFSVPYSPLHRHLLGQDKQQQHSSQSLIQEVTSHSFLDTVMDSQKVR